MNLCDTCTHINCPASRKDVEITSDADIIKCNKYKGDKYNEGQNNRNSPR